MQNPIESNNDETSLPTAILESCTEFAVIAVDLEWNIIAWNEGASRLFNYSALEMIGTANFKDLSLPEEILGGKIKEIFKTTLKTGLWRGVLSCLCKNTTQVPVLCTITLRTNTVDKPIGYTIIAYDHTEFSNKIKTLTETKEYTRSLIESNIDALITTDSLGIITDANKQFCELTEVPLDSLVGTPFKHYFTETKRAEDLIRRVLSANRIANYELVIQSVNNKLTPVSFNVTTFYTADGHLKGIFTTARDITEQKRLEQQSQKQSVALLEATNLLNDVLKSAITYSVIAQDLEGNILLWNEGAKRNFGYSTEEMIGQKSLSILQNPDEIKSGNVLGMLDEAFKTGRSEGIVECLRKNGDPFSAMFSVSTRRDEEGKPIGYVIISKDISIQRQQEQELREQLSYNRSLFESSIDVLIATDTLGIITDVNKQMCALTGYKLEDLVGTEFKNCFTDPKRAEDCIRNVLADEIVKNYVLTIKAKDNKEIVMSCNATTFRATDNTLRGVFAVARDITEQKRLEEESLEQNTKLNEATGFLNNVLESSTAYSIIAEDLEGNILAWNEGARLNYGYTAEEMVGKQNTRILHAPEDINSGRLQTVLDSALKTGKEEGVLESVRKNGERFTASLALTLRKDASGKPVGYVLISKDITDQKREEVLVTKNVELIEQNRLAQEANRLKSEFLANMSHELRSPLNGIIGFADLMYLGKAGSVSPEHKEYLADILTSSRHLLQLINDILDLAKVESGKMEFHPEKLDINVIITEVCDILRTLIAKGQIELSIEVDPSIAQLLIDPAKLKQVLYNYISNALKFTPEGGSIHIRALPEGTDYFRIEVIDSGIGIAEEDIPKLYTEFQQLDASLDKKYQGTGLGLALTKRIAEALGGQVGVKSEPGVGSTFFIILPLAPMEVAKEPSKEPSTDIPIEEPIIAPPPQLEINVIPYQVETEKTNVSPIIVPQPSILVIEDSAEDNALIVQTLINEGYKVESASTGGEAIKLCMEKKYDAITLDLLLPDINGWEVLRTFRSKGPNIETPSIVVTVVGSKAISFGFMIQYYLVKPIKSEELISALQQTGINPNQNKTILFVDNDPQMLTLCNQYLEDYGSTVICESSPEEALTIAYLKHPDVIILDLLMLGIDGLEFLRRFRVSDYGKNTPVIICTSQDMGELDRKRIKTSVASVVQKGGEAMKNLIVELQTICPVKKIDDQ